ncbi:MAG: BON domain-containing protein [Chlamydiota bacterium]
MKKLLPAIALCTLLVSCSPTPPSPMASYANAQPGQEESQSLSSDWEITMRIKETILGDSALSPSNRLISVNTTNGVVTLTGNVSSQDQIDEIMNKVAAIPGVKKVVNQMALSQS